MTRALKALVLGGVVFFTAGASRDVVAATPSQIAVADVATPPPDSGLDRAALKRAAEGEIRTLATPNTKGRRVLVSVALLDDAKGPNAYRVNATLREARTGRMIAIVEGHAHAESETAPSPALKAQVARAALRSAVRRIPDALAQ